MILSHGTKSHMLVSKLHCGTFKTMQLVPVHLGLPLFWKYHCATCSPACVILYHLTGSCKGLINCYCPHQPNVDNESSRPWGITDFSTQGRQFYVKPRGKPLTLVHRLVDQDTCKLVSISTGVSIKDDFQSVLRNLRT